MKYFVPADQNWIRALKRWLTSPDTLRTLRAIETWADSPDRAGWGEASVFLEVAFPWNRKRQADLIVAFRNRLVICEEKSRPLDQIRERLPGFIETLEGLRNQLKQRLSAQAVAFVADPEVLFFCRQRTPEEIEAIKTELVRLAHPHVGVAGELRPGAEYAHDLPSVLARQLARSQTSGHQSVADGVLATIEQPLISFPDLEGVLTFLAQNLVGVENVTSAPWYLADLRAVDYRRFNESLSQLRFVDLVSDPGLGKSELVKQYVRNHPQRPCCSVSLGNCRSVDKLLQQVYRGVTDSDPVGLGRTKLLEEVDGRGIVVWVESYHSAARDCIREFLKKSLAERPTEPAGDRTVWIFESLRPLDVPHLRTIELQPLDRPAISAILSRLVLPASVDIGSAVATAGGNPGLAIAMTRSTRSTITAVEVPSNYYEYFLDTLSPPARAILDLLVVLDALAPLGYTDTLVFQAAEQVFPHLRGRLREEIDNLIEDLVRFGFASVVNVDLASIDPTPEYLFARHIEPITFVDRINQRLVERIRSGVGPSVERKFVEAIQQALVSRSRGGNDLSEVTFSLIDGDIWPFFTSAFRHTNSHVHRVLEWITTNPHRDFKPGQDYIIRALGLLLELKTLGARANGDEFPLEPPNPANAQQVHAYDAFRARWQERREERPNVDTWLAWAANTKDPDLRVEITVRLVEVLLRAEDYKAAWELLQELLERRAGVTAAGRGLLMWHVFALLNRKKDAKQAGLDDAAIEAAMRKHAAEFVAVSQKTENIRGLANALFFCARDVEYQASRGGTSLADVSKTLPALEFVEQVSPTRRVQAALTQGSVYRHLCRSGLIQFPEFMQNLRASVLVYERAYRSAISTDRDTHRLNAASYMGNVCRLGLRFADAPGAAADLSRAASRALPYLIDTLAETTAAFLGTGDREKRKNIEYEAALLSFLVATVEHERTFGGFVDDTLERVFAEQAHAAVRVGRPFHERSKSVRSFLRDCSHLIKMVTSTVMAHPEQPVCSIAAFQQALEETAEFAKSDRTGVTLKEWKKLEGALQRFVDPC